MKKYLYIAIFCIITTFITIKSLPKTSKVGFNLTDLNNIEVLANEETNTSCTVTFDCIDPYYQTKDGSVSCTGKKCERGRDLPNKLPGLDRRYVECDGVRTYC